MLKSKVFRYLKLLIGLDPWLFKQIKLPTERFGSKYAGWTIAPDKINSKSIIYSFGIGTDISFENDLIKKYSLSINAFDPTPRSLAWVKKQKLPKTLKVYPWGLADYDGKANFSPPEKANYVSFRIDKKNKRGHQLLPVFRLKTIMDKLGYKKIDLLKMDIEGAEFEVLEDILKSKIDIKQICVEFHHRFKGVGKKATEEIVHKMNKAGYLIYDISDSGVEYSFKLEDRS